MSPSATVAPTRAVLVHVLMVGGYVIAVVVAFLLVAAPLIEWMVFGRLDPLVFVAVVLGALLFRIVVPDPVRFEPAGPQVVRDEQPELFEILDMVASAIRQPMPREVYLLEEMNAYVAEIGGIFGVGSRRVVGIGVPLMSVLDPEEFGAVVAHEFGHLNREAGRIGAMVYMTRQAVVRQVIDAPRSLLHRPLMAYARLYLRATASTARAQEFGADALAARATSTKAVAGALARLPFGTVAYDVYHRTEYLPLLASGRQPPLLEGFETFLTSSVAREHLPSSGDAALGSSTGTALDAHPPVRERLEALGVPAADVEERPLPAVRATALLRDTGRVEATLAAGHLDEGATLAPIAWDEVGSEVLVPRWRRDRAALVGDLPAGFHLGALPLDREGLAELGTDVAQHSGQELDDVARIAQGHRAARAIIGETAVDRGLDVEMVPGEPVWFGRPPEQFGLFAAYDAVVEGRDAPDSWIDLLVEAGLADPTESPSVQPDPTPAGVPIEPTSTSAAPAPIAPTPPAPTPPARPDTSDDEAPFRSPAFVAATLRQSDAATPPVQPLEPAESLAAARPSAPLEPPRSAGAERSTRTAVPSAHRRKVFRIPAGMGRHHDLILDGDTVTYRDQSVSADDVTHVAYWSGDDAEVRLWVNDQVMRIRLAGGQKAKDVHGGAWEALVAWIDARVAPRLVQRAMARIAERGRVQVGDQTITATGVVIRGRVVPWAVLIGASLDGREIHLHQRTDGDPAGTIVSSLDASEPNIVLVPPLMVAVSASAAESSGATR